MEMLKCFLKRVLVYCLSYKLGKLLTIRLNCILQMQQYLEKSYKNHSFIKLEEPLSRYSS